ncbi:MAG: glycogen/starch/alpha-glucan phosphorylase [Tissierellaceae bacterium]|nr:glycogen/starch/alpha-glucan phosphorylase [Tissierellaceae bacterium]
MNKIDNIRSSLQRYSLTTFGKKLEECNLQEKYRVLSESIMEEVLPLWMESKEQFKNKRQAYYLSAEYLMGRALSNNLINLGYIDDIKLLLEEMGINYNEVEEIEPDAALGNGGLGRLAACFLDSAATLNLPLSGYGIRYEYGLFKQGFKDGFQDEKTDDWLQYGDPWSIRKESESKTIHFTDGDIKAVPYDTPIIGFGKQTINTLRLWKAESIEPFSFEEFNKQNYDLSVKEKNKAENISKVLYPNDSNREGKKLRLKQQYFFVSASIQDLIEKHKKNYESLDKFSDLNVLQLNDTHPAVAIPELMRILTEVENVDWEKAWEITVQTFAYTNHTILQEALEQWDIGLYQELLPHVYRVIEKINVQLREELLSKGIAHEDLAEYEIISNGQIKMAYLSIYGSHSTNGVARLHTEILKNRELNNWYRVYPDKFNNKTNGITQRRWLLLSNPELSKLITELLGSDKWITDLSQLKKLEKFAEDEDVQNRFLSIKKLKKVQLAEYIKEHEGIEVDPNSIFDIQIKRFHEYKRQLLNAFQILDLYYRLKDNPELDIYPRTFIFGGKAAPGYYRAKAVIKFINDIADLINNDKDINGKIKVVFVKNYRVSYAEKLFPAADISEQISTAGKEASGTGNMKFMLNGAPTIGTYDGANVEIVEEAGEENNFIFGLRVEDIERIKDSYNPQEYYNNVPGLKRVVDSLIDGTFDIKAKDGYKELYDSLLHGAHWHEPDVYYLMADFDGYREAQNRVDKEFRDRLSWAKKSWINLSNAGKFSSDRTVKDYANEIWRI